MHHEKDEAMRIWYMLFIICLLSLSPIDYTHAQSERAIVAGDCNTTTTLDRDVECGTIQVPLDHDNPTGKSATLPIMVVKAETPSTNTPLYLLQGGPGGNTIDTFAFLISEVDSVLPNDRDIVFYEQRGTSTATPALDCPEVHQLGISLLAEDISYTEGVDKYITAYEQCTTRLRNAGINLQLFNSRQNALDTIYIADKLGHQSIDLYGVSYGSLLAQHVTRLKPELVRTLVIDGIVPTNESVDARVYQSRHEALDTIFRDCENTSVCANAYPQLRQTYADVMADYAANPRMWELTDPADPSVTRTARVDHHVLQGWLFSWMYDDQLASFIPLMITQLADGRVEQVRLFAGFNVFDDSIAEMMYMSTQCGEEAILPTTDYVIPSNNLIPLMEDELENDERYRKTICSMSGVTALDAAFNAEFRTDVPTLIVSGRYDPITPAAFGDIVAQSVPQATHIIIPNGAHGAMLSNACAADIAKAFWANPTAPLDTSCVAEQRPQFPTPDTLIVTDFAANTAQLNENTTIQWVLIGGAYIVLLFGLFVRITRTFIRMIRGNSAKPLHIRQQRFMQMLVIISGLALTSYVMWQLIWLVLTNDYTLFFGIPDTSMIIRVGTWIFMGLSIFNLISAIRAMRHQQMPWYSVLFAVMIIASSLGLSTAFILSGIY